MLGDAIDGPDPTPQHLTRKGVELDLGIEPFVDRPVVDVEQLSAHHHRVEVGQAHDPHSGLDVVADLKRSVVDPVFLDNDDALARRSEHQPVDLGLGVGGRALCLFQLDLSYGDVTVRGLSAACEVANCLRLFELSLLELELQARHLDVRLETFGDIRLDARTTQRRPCLLQFESRLGEVGSGRRVSRLEAGLCLLDLGFQLLEIGSQRRVVELDDGVTRLDLSSLCSEPADL